MANIKSDAAITEEIANSIINHVSEASLASVPESTWTDVPVQSQCVGAYTQSKGVVDTFKAIMENEAAVLKEIGAKFDSVDTQLSNNINNK